MSDSEEGSDFSDAESEHSSGSEVSFVYLLPALSKY